RPARVFHGVRAGPLGEVLRGRGGLGGHPRGLGHTPPGRGRSPPARPDAPHEGGGGTCPRRRAAAGVFEPVATGETSSPRIRGYFFVVFGLAAGAASPRTSIWKLPIATPPALATTW